MVKIASSSSLLFATLAISSSSSNLANAAPAGDSSGIQEISRAASGIRQSVRFFQRGIPPLLSYQSDLEELICGSVVPVLGGLPVIGPILGGLTAGLCPKPGVESVDQASTQTALDSQTAEKLKQLKAAVEDTNVSDSPDGVDTPEDGESEEGDGTDDSPAAGDPALDPNQPSGTSPPPNTPNPASTAGAQDAEGTNDPGLIARRSAVLVRKPADIPSAPAPPKGAGPPSPPHTPSHPTPPTSGPPSGPAVPSTVPRPASVMVGPPGVVPPPPAAPVVPPTVAPPAPQMPVAAPGPPATRHPFPPRFMFPLVLLLLLWVEVHKF
ncbi:hypothetical protein DL96DRAFT_1712977 [Flagelloscypha sp. PMI_526]|nr:hypothetical protein DL96DRAFT_1712977 [Flagelloscypha sp. PMI_526]